MSMSGDLADVREPCPFCGGEDIRHDDDGWKGWLTCTNCGAIGPYSADDAAAGLTIEQAWDKRFPK